MATENTRDDVTRTLAEPRRTTFRIFYGRLRSGVIILPMRITAQAYYLFQFPGLAFAVSQRLSLFHVVSFQVSQFLYALISRHGWNHIRILCYANQYLIFLPKSNWNQLGNRKNEGLSTSVKISIMCSVPSATNYHWVADSSHWPLWPVSWNWSSHGQSSGAK